MTLRARLLLALLAMALIPIVVFMVFTIDQLDRSTQRWFRPGVERALGSALDVARSGLTRIEAITLAQAEALAPLAATLPLTEANRNGLRLALRASGLDLAQVYALEPGGWRLVEQVSPPGVLAPDEPDLSAIVERALDSSRVVHAEQGVLGGVASAAPGTALLAGVWVAPDYFDRVRDVGQGVSHYGRLSVLVPIQRRYVWLLVAALVLGLALLAVALANAVARGMSRPLRDLSVALERVAAGDLATRVTPAGARELRGLGESFNSMSARLEAARESVAQAEREAAWRDVARHLAHEIKNPLTAMRYALHRIERRIALVPEPDRSPVRHSVDAILREVKDLAYMAEQFAQYARKPEPRFEPLDFGALVRDAAALQEPEALALRESGEPLPVRADRVLLSRAVQNLIVNAREAGPADQPIEVVLGRDGGRAWLEVLDRGPGLPAGSADRWFEPYASTKNRGSGLGLSLVRDVAQQHGGAVALENREGGGACARLWIPLAGEANEGRNA